MPPRSVPLPPDADKDIPMDVVPSTFEIDDNGLKLSLTIIDTPGCGSNINSQGSIEKVLQYIEKQYDEILQEEARIKRNPKFQDNRVHAVLYFIQPTGHSLKEIDIEFMKRLAHCSNVIPVIAKSDSLTPAELASFKKQIMDEIIQRKIPIYDFPIDPDHDDEETVEENAELRALLPFAVVGSEEEFNQGGRKIRCRKYPWGLVEGKCLIQSTTRSTAISQS
jgi:cell division control protein 11